MFNLNLLSALVQENEFMAARVQLAFASAEDITNNPEVFKAAFVEAVKNGEVAFVDALLQKDGFDQVMNSLGYTLAYAISSGNFDMVNRLLNEISCVDALKLSAGNQNSYTLQSAMLNDDLSIFNRLLEVPGIKEIVGNESGRDAKTNAILFYAAANGKLDLIKILMEIPNVIQKIEENRSRENFDEEYYLTDEPLWVATYFNQPEALVLLLQYSVNQNLAKEVTQEVIERASEIDSSDIYSILLAFGFDISEFKPNQAIFDAINTGPAMVDAIFEADNVQFNQPRNRELLFAKNICRSLVEANSKQPLEQILSYLPMMQGPKNENGESVAEQRINTSNARVNRP